MFGNVQQLSTANFWGNAGSFLPPSSQSSEPLLERQRQESIDIEAVQKRAEKPGHNRQRPTRQHSLTRLSEQVINIIGENGQRRFQEFIKYPDGWAGGQGKPLSAGSVNTLEQFLRHLPELAAYRSSLFLGYEGNLQLSWKDVRGGDVEIEFFPNRLEYFAESLNEEKSVSDERMLDLVVKIKSLCA